MSINCSSCNIPVDNNSEVSPCCLARFHHGCFQACIRDKLCTNCGDRLQTNYFNEKSVSVLTFHPSDESGDAELAQKLHQEEVKAVKGKEQQEEKDAEFARNLAKEDRAIASQAKAFQEKKDEKFARELEEKDREFDPDQMDEQRKQIESDETMAFELARQWGSGVEVEREREKPAIQRGIRHPVPGLAVNGPDPIRDQLSPVQQRLYQASFVVLALALIYQIGRMFF